MVHSKRISITLRLFLGVFLITLVLSSLSTLLLWWSFQRNFSNYVSQVEMQKLNHLNNNLAEIYQVYGDWDQAFKVAVQDANNKRPRRAQLNIDKNVWFLKQYQIAQQQNEILKNPALFKARLTSEQAQDQLPIPSHFEPFAPISESQRHQARQSRGFSFSNHDELGLSGRLGLYDHQQNHLAGVKATNMVLQEILVEKKIVGYLALKPSLSQDDVLSIKFFKTQQRYLFFVYILSFILSLIVALLLARSFRKPIKDLLFSANQLSQGNYQHHVDIKRNDELGDLSQVMNQLADILYQHEQSRRQWVADTSHELKTPLAVLQAQIAAMQDGIRQATPEHLAKMQHQVSSLKKLTQDLADLAQADAQQLKCEFKMVDVWAIVEDEISNFQEKFEQKEMNVQLDGASVTLTTDVDRLRQIIVNILSNSLRYTEQGGTIHVHTVVQNGHWILHIDDSPLGLSDEQLAQLGQRFYRVDDSRTRSTGGTGLGLALSKKIAQILGGDLKFAHSPLGGLRCSIDLPCPEHQSTLK